MSQCLHAADALLPTGWARDVLLEWDAHGELVAVTPDVPAPEGDRPLSEPCESLARWVLSPEPGRLFDEVLAP